jgi:hypothetical protein
MASNQDETPSWLTDSSPSAPAATPSSSASPAAGGFSSSSPAATASSGLASPTNNNNKANNDGSQQNVSSGAGSDPASLQGMYVCCSWTCYSPPFCCFGGRGGSHMDRT